MTSFLMFFVEILAPNKKVFNIRELASFVACLVKDSPALMCEVGQY